MDKRILLSLIMVGGLSQASAITITSNSVEVRNRTSEAIVADSFTGTSIPTSVFLDATSSSGAYWSRIRVDYTGSGDQVTISNAFNHKRDGTYGDFSNSVGNTMCFTVGSNTTYDLSGFYNVNDESAAGSTFLYSYLWDSTASTYLVHSYQLSLKTINEQFVLRDSGGEGDHINNNSGSLSGHLLAGHSYEFYCDALTHAYPDADSGASAKGNITLKIGGGALISDCGATAVLMGLALLGLAAARRRLAA